MTEGSNINEEKPSKFYRFIESLIHLRYNVNKSIPNSRMGNHEESPSSTEQEC